MLLEKLTQADIEMIKKLCPLERAGVGPTGLGRGYGIMDRVDGDNPRYYLMVGGVKGCVVFLFGPDYTHSIIGHTPIGNAVIGGVEWMPWTISIHHARRAADYLLHHQSCYLLEGMPCWFDDTCLGAVELLEQIPDHDEEWLWRELEEWYRLHLEED